MTQLKKSAKSVSMVILLTLISKVLGFVRESLIASNYGAGISTDTFFIALSAITLFSTILTHTINTVLIPILSDIEVHEGKEGKLKHLNNFLNIIVLVSILITFLAFFITPYLMKVLGRGFKREQFEYVILLTRLGLPILIISTIVGIFRGFLQSEEKFVESATADLPMNIIYILFLFFLAQHFSITALMIISVIAEASKLLIQVPSIWKLGYRYQLIIDLKNKYMIQIATLIPPILLSIGINDLNSLIDKSMASSLIKGSISALNYSNLLKNLVHTVFITAIITVVFPIFSKQANAIDFIKLKKTMQVSLNLVLLITIPASVGMIILAQPVVKFVYQRGQFDEMAALMTSSALVYYLIGLTATGVKALLIQLFYALQDTKIPMKNSFYSLILNLIFNLLFIRYMGHNGLALASSLSAIVTAFILLYELRKKIGNLGLTAILQSSIKIVVSSIAMGIFVYFIYNHFLIVLTLPRIVELLILMLIIISGAIVYLGFLYLFKTKELYFLINYIKSKTS